MAGESKVGTVREYLTEEFGSGEVTVEPEAAGMVFRVTVGRSRYVLTVVREFLASHDATDIRGLLGRWKVGEELRRADGLPMVVSEEGLRLASGN